ncbi:MAG: helix-turn-helix transcriptional regulator, partial [Verrucomicrobiota bacterium]
LLLLSSGNMRILNLYAGIGGNRKLWGDKHEVVAVEKDPRIALSHWGTDYELLIPNGSIPDISSLKCTHNTDREYFLALMPDYVIFIPFGNKGGVMTIGEIGRTIRQERKSQGLTQGELAMTANTASRFISELENGKATCQIGKALKVIHCLGIKIELKTPSQSKANT